MLDRGLFRPAQYRDPGRVRGSCQQGVTPPTPYPGLHARVDDYWSRLAVFDTLRLTSRECHAHAVVQFAFLPNIYAIFIQVKRTTLQVH